MKAKATPLLATMALCGTTQVLSMAHPASEAVAQTVLRACFVPNTGVVYRIDAPGAPDECRSDRHVEFQWTDADGADHGGLTGLGDDDHPEYVRSGETAGGDLTGTYLNPTVAGLQGHDVANDAPSGGDVLTWDGTEMKWAPAAPSGGGGGVTDHSLLSNLDADDHTQYVLADGVRSTTNGFAVTGALSTGSIPVEGSGVRIMWYPNKAAFRAGYASGTQWNDANIGNQSTALGRNSTGSGLFSTAMGRETTASGVNSTAMGFTTMASGESSTAMANQTTASGHSSSAMGRLTTASGARATAMGDQTTASGDNSTAMGSGTTASGTNSTAMGFGTTASGSNAATAMGIGTTASGSFSTAMGSGTTASGSFSTAMGSGTTASGVVATAMGSLTTASGDQSTAMGSVTTASGLYSTAMGRLASTDGMAGSFVYGDNSVAIEGILLAPAPNSFSVRAAGGTTFYSSGDYTTGVVLAAGGGSWGAVSDRNRKENFRNEDGEATLTKIAAMPIHSWNYKAQDRSIRHMGPTAQDFYAAFGLGESELTITTTDIDGVNLLAVQALEKRTAELRAENESLRGRLDKLEAIVRSLVAHRSSTTMK